MPMAGGGKQRGKGGRPPRNPFAGRRRSGAGPHSPRKYDKATRRKLRRETEKEAEADDEPPPRRQNQDSERGGPAGPPLFLRSPATRALLTAPAGSRGW